MSTELTIDEVAAVRESARASLKRALRKFPANPDRELPTAGAHWPTDSRRYLEGLLAAVEVIMAATEILQVIAPDEAKANSPTLLEVVGRLIRRYKDALDAQVATLPDAVRPFVEEATIGGATIESDGAPPAANWDR
jgi:hypothetical protein